MTHLIIVSRRPGMIRGGRQHPPVAVYSAEQALDFTPHQLADIAAEPEMTMVVGEVVAPDGIEAMVADFATAIEAAAKKAKK
jgi:hypothetical protein